MTEPMNPAQIAAMVDGALYFVKWGTDPEWIVMTWRNGIFWDDADRGYLPTALGTIGPMVLMPDALEAQAAEIARLTGVNEVLRQAQPYRYIGKNGKPILARDLEDQRDAAEAKVAALTAALRMFANPENWFEEDPRDYGEPMIQCWCGQAATPEDLARAALEEAL